MNNIYVSFDVPKAEVKGSSHIENMTDKDLIIHKGRLEISYIKFDGETVEHDDKVDIIKLPAKKHLEIGFKGVFKGKDEKENVISTEGISLTGLWYPQVEGLGCHGLEVTLPGGYKAISEAEEIKMIEGKNLKFYFRFPYPVHQINLVASNRYEVTEDRYNDIEIYVYLFNEDRELAQRYIDYTKKYLKLYEGMLGRFPYKRFSIVENFLPTGYSMPTFTLLGSSVIRLPFIVETSLGHEILHQWFGNMVYIDYKDGNWSEGLTTYLSDHLYREEEGRGWEYRKKLLVDYKSYVNEENEFSLRGFRGRFDEASKAIGYGKSAMVFHMLKNLLGEEVFFSSLRDFIEGNRFRDTSWDDLIKSFEKHYKEGALGWFFRQWIDGKGYPELYLEDVKLGYTGGGYELGFKLRQEGNPYNIDVPVTIYSGGRGIKRFFRVSESEKIFKIYMSERPERVVLDEDYDIARRLATEETPATISRLLGGDNYIVVLPVEDKERYKSIIRFFGDKDAMLKEAEDIKDSEIKLATLIVLDSDNPLIKRLYGRVDMGDEGVEVLMKKNPWDEERVVGIFNSASRDEVDSAFKKISHYGRYSRLLFRDGTNMRKEVSDSERGISVDIYREPSVIDISSIKRLPDIIDRISHMRVIYVGEFHDIYAHHITQLEVIRMLYKRNRKLAIGMEMFQRPFQDVLNDYTGGRVGERVFLEGSEYYKRWRFDYNLYKPILEFAASKGIPVIALNIKKEIIDKVSEKGIDSLTEEEKAMLPEEMDFSDTQYRERLWNVFKQHKDWEKKNFDYFYQSQVIWDETMAESIDRFLKDNPGYQMVVIAGQGHLEYGSGIPKRAYRKNGHEYAILLLDATADTGIADYIVFPEEVEAPSSPRLMVFLKTEEGKVRITGFPDDSVSKRAGLKEGDVIVALDDEPVQGIEDIKLNLFYKRNGDIVRVKVRRGENEAMRELEFNVRLKSP